jgi:hypothetical protein
MSSSPTVWHNSLVKPRSNLHHKPWERNKIMFMSFHLLKTCIRNPSLLFIYLFIYFFTLPPGLPRRCQLGSTRVPRGDISFAKFAFLPSWFAKCCRLIFLVLPKLDGCQVSLLKCKRCSHKNNIIFTRISKKIILFQKFLKNTIIF